MTIELGNKIKRTSIVLLVMLLIYSTTTPIILAEGFSDIENEVIRGKIVTEEETVSVYTEADSESEILASLEIDREVIIVEKLENMTKILVFLEDKTDDLEGIETLEDGDKIIGFVLNDNIEIITTNEVEHDKNSQHDKKEIPKVGKEDNGNSNESIEKSMDELESKEDSLIKPKTEISMMATNLKINNTLTGVASKANTNVYSQQSDKSKVLKSYVSGTILKFSKLNNSWHLATVYINGRATQGYISVKDVDNIISNQKTTSGIALGTQTNVYASPSTDAKVYKTYPKNTVLKYSTFSGNWHEATVYINGKATIGYIQRSDVETAVEKSENLKGIALQTQTNVYSNASTSSKVHKSYPKGSILSYKSFTKNWYEAKVYINGKATTGYLYRTHVENATKNQKSLKGIALQQQTNVFSRASTGANVHKSYAKGTLLNYQSFTKDWYQATVYLNGKATIGYIHHSHVETGSETPKSLKGIALQTQTNVYSTTSLNSKIQKSYPKGTLLNFKSFTKDWYEAKVYINGKATTGYIHRSHVEKSIENQQSLKGIGLNAPTNIYSTTSTNSKVHKSYAQGTILQYKTFTKDWYEAVVYINGKKTTGYILHSHVEDVVSKQQSLTGYANKDFINIYNKASENSTVIKKYPLNSSLKFKSFTSKWYEARVSISGKYVTGYIRKSDISSDKIEIEKPNQSIIVNTNYSISLKNIVTKQFEREKPPNKDGGGSKVSTRGEVEFFMNPLNFPEGSEGVYQFIVLNQSANLNVADLNNGILRGKGILQNQGKAFVDAGKQKNVNEAYLIAHALLETGNGTSVLANGIWVDENGKVTKNENGDLAKTATSKFKVYNMYGYGAINDCPIECGAERAFKEKWFSPETAIIGGATNIQQQYIDAGLNTPYKMRWNPASPSHWRQYATHTKWAYLQTGRIANIYSSLNKYTLRLDIPNYIDMPNYDVGANARIKGNNVNFRSGPGTHFDIIETYANNTKVKVKGGQVAPNSEGWYQVENNGRIGWVTADYVELDN